MSAETDRLIEITLDEGSLAPASANAEHERRIALFDLKEANAFAVVGAARGPYGLMLAVSEGRLAFDVSDSAGERVVLHHMPLSPVRKLIKDYAFICESYHNAIRSAAPSQIEAIDMGRRGLHNEAGEILMDALAERFVIDLETARRLFTLICALHVRG
ncbi:MAG TPA: UPF0262 family protein [Terricaulis sp.]|mgnify:CR=1 FL=1|nr:UPF0262 family protein [Terricaulis sp.]